MAAGQVRGETQLTPSRVSRRRRRADACIQHRKFRMFYTNRTRIEGQMIEFDAGGWVLHIRVPVGSFQIASRIKLKEL